MENDQPQPGPFGDSPERYRMLLESISDYAVIVMNEQRTITDWNTGAERIFGFTPEQAIGQPGDIIFTPEDRAAGAPEQECQGAIAKGSTADERWHLRVDGTRRFVAGRMQTIRERGKVTGFIKMARDETQRRLAADQLTRAKREAEEANASKDRFLAVLSHELRNPLTPILAATHLLLQDPRTPDDLRQDLLSIQRNTQLEARLIDDLLDATRVARGKVQLHLQTVMVETLVQHVVEICRPDIKAKSLELKISFGARDCCVKGDPARIQQILWNLLRNAVKFSQEHGTIQVETRNPTPDFLEVRVADTGIGIAPENLQRIFQPFEQVAQGQFGGLGLGLSISRGMAELHGGSVIAESPGLGKGSIMRLTLPVTSESECLPALPQRPSGRSSGPSWRILLVEDNLDTARSLARILRLMGHDVSTAASVTEAQRLSEAQPFDILLSDIGLGAENGWNLLKSLREKQPGLRAIAMSGYGSEEDKQRSREAGFSEHLIKPLDFAALERALAHEQLH